jgi:hypothetical protein
MDPERACVVTATTGERASTQVKESIVKILKLAAAAAIALTSISLPASPAAAQHRWHNDRGDHHGWRNHHRTRTVCTARWRHHHRVRVCRTVRW